MWAGLVVEQVTSEWIGPVEPKLPEQRFASGVGLLTQRSAGRTRFARHTLGSIHRAQEGLQSRRAVYFNQRVKIVQIQTRLLLGLVAEGVGHYCLGVGQVRAQRNRDGLTFWGRGRSWGGFWLLEGQHSVHIKFKSIQSLIIFILHLLVRLPENLDNNNTADMSKDMCQVDVTCAKTCLDPTLFRSN